MMLMEHVFCFEFLSNELSNPWEISPGGSPQVLSDQRRWAHVLFGPTMGPRAR